MGERPLYQPLFPEYVPFPVECLPGPVCQYVLAQAAALDCDPGAVALPVLSVLASSIGSTRRIRLKRAWSEPAILWTAVVAENGDSFRLPLEAAVGPLSERQSVSLRAHAAQVVQYEKDLSYYKRAKRRYYGTGPKPPPEPVEPTVTRSVTSDVQAQTVVNLLSRQPRGVLVCAEELDGWLGRPNAASARRVADVANWLALHRGQPLTIERRTGKAPAIHAPYASASLAGMLQPESLGRKLLESHAPCGLTSRLLFALPPSVPRKWTDSDVSEPTVAAYVSVLDKLLTLGAGETAPTFVELSPPAKQRFGLFMNYLARDEFEADAALKPWFANLQGYVARLTLVLHLARWGAGEQVDPQVCDRDSLDLGIKLARWFAYETRRLFQLFCESALEHEQGLLMDWLLKRGNRASARDLCRSNARKYPTLEAATVALEHLVQSGIGRWVDQPSRERGGRPTRVMVIGGAIDEGTKKQEAAPGGTGADNPGNPACLPGSVGQISRDPYTAAGSSPASVPLSYHSTIGSVPSDDGGDIPPHAPPPPPKQQYEGPQFLGKPRGQRPPNQYGIQFVPSKTNRPRM